MPDDPNYHALLTIDGYDTAAPELRSDLADWLERCAQLVRGNEPLPAYKMFGKRYQLRYMK